MDDYEKGLSQPKAAASLRQTMTAADSGSGFMKRLRHVGQSRVGWGAIGSNRSSTKAIQGDLLYRKFFQKWLNRCLNGAAIARFLSA
jgi:hypothetical protein